MNTTFFHTTKLFACGWLIAAALSFSACGTDQAATERRGALVGAWTVNEHRVEILDGNIRKDTTLQRTVGFNEDGTASVTGSMNLTLNWLYQFDPEQVGLFSTFGGGSSREIFPIQFDVTDHTGDTWKFHGEKTIFVFEDSMSLRPQLIVDWTLEK